jgi:hypothetical protein
MKTMKSVKQILSVSRGIEKKRMCDSGSCSGYPYLRGEDVSKYSFTYAGRCCKEAGLARRNSPFWPLDDDTEKILIKRQSREIIAAFDVENLVADHSLYYAVLKDHLFNMKYLVGILNSKAANYTLYNASSRKPFRYITKAQLDALPIPSIPSSDQDVIALLVSFVLLLKNPYQQSVSDLVSNEVISSVIESAINACVFELYCTGEIRKSKTAVMRLFEEFFKSMKDLKIEKQIVRTFNELNEHKSELRNRILRQLIECPYVDTVSKFTYNQS